MPNGATDKVKKRAEKVMRLVRARGCITTSVVMEMGYSKTQAEVVLRHLVAAGRATRVRVGHVSLWCCSKSAAERHVRRLRSVLHALICAAKLNYVAPSDALVLIVRNRAAADLFTRYVKLSTSSAVLNFLASLLESAYGKPAFYKRRGSMPMFFVDQKKRCDRR